MIHGILISYFFIMCLNVQYSFALMPNICMKAAVNTEGNGVGHDDINPPVRPSFDCF